MVTHQNWQALGLNGLYGTNTVIGGGGGNSDFIFTRDRLDALRIGQGRVPTAEYPDGYLGEVNSRRGDRLLDSLKNRENQRSYQRGIHKGERTDPADYFYPRGLDPQRGLRAEAKGKRQAPVMRLAAAPHLVNDGKSDLPNHLPVVIDPKRAAEMARLMPAWS